jgi:hypothetical protein
VVYAERLITVKLMERLQQELAAPRERRREANGNRAKVHQKLARGLWARKSHDLAAQAKIGDAFYSTGNKMNFNQLNKSIGCCVQLAPIACRLDENNRELSTIDDDWIIEEVTDAGVEIRNVRTSHVIILGKDHIRNFTSDPYRSMGRIKFGFLTLYVQVFLQGYRCWIRPIERPGESQIPINSRNSPTELARAKVVRRCPDCGQDSHLANGWITTFDSEWVCSNDNCVSKRR